MTTTAPVSSEAENQRLRAEIRQLNTVIHELWLRVADAGTLMNTSWVRSALEGSTELTDEDGTPRNAFKLPAHMRND